MALLRNWLAGGAAADQRAAEITRLAERITRDQSVGFQMDISEREVADGYGEWSETYDTFPNPLIEVEQAAVRSLVDRFAGGRALDAATGTGRHAKYLRQRGHDVVAIDATAGMLERARLSMPDVRCERGELEALPLADNEFDLVVCALALTHVPSLTKPLAEIARVLKPGGSAIISDFHPVSSLLGGGALFQGKRGSWGNVKSYRHLHADYIAAFNAAGLEIRECVEPIWSEKEASGGPLFALAPEAFKAGLVGVPLALIWLLRKARD